MNEMNAIAKSIHSLDKQAFAVYRPIVDDICSKKAVSQNELESLLDWMVSICISDRMLTLYKRVCRRFYNQYPEVITDYMVLYKEIYGEKNEA